MQFVFFIALLVVSYAITALTASKPKQDNSGPTKLNDIKFPVPDEGTPQAVIFGDVWAKDWMILWVGNYKTEEIYTQAQGGGGKK